MHLGMNRIMRNPLQLLGILQNGNGSRLQTVEETYANEQFREVDHASHINVQPANASETTAHASVHSTEIAVPGPPAGITHQHGSEEIQANELVLNAQARDQAQLGPNPDEHRDLPQRPANATAPGRAVRKAEKRAREDIAAASRKYIMLRNAEHTMQADRRALTIPVRRPRLQHREPIRGRKTYVSIDSNIPSFAEEFPQDGCQPDDLVRKQVALKAALLHHCCAQQPVLSLSFPDIRGTLHDAHLATLQSDASFLTLGLLEQRLTSLCWDVAGWQCTAPRSRLHASNIATQANAILASHRRCPPRRKLLSGSTGANRQHISSSTCRSCVAILEQASTLAQELASSWPSELKVFADSLLLGASAMPLSVQQSKLYIVRKLCGIAQELLCDIEDLMAEYEAIAAQRMTVGTVNVKEATSITEDLFKFAHNLKPCRWPRNMGSFDAMLRKLSSQLPHYQAHPLLGSAYIYMQLAARLLSTANQAHSGVGDAAEAAMHKSPSSNLFIEAGSPAATVQWAAAVESHTELQAELQPALSSQDQHIAPKVDESNRVQDVIPGTQENNTAVYARFQKQPATLVPQPTSHRNVAGDASKDDPPGTCLDTEAIAVVGTSYSIQQASASSQQGKGLSDASSNSVGLSPTSNLAVANTPGSVPQGLEGLHTTLPAASAGSISAKHLVGQLLDTGNNTAVSNPAIDSCADNMDSQHCAIGSSPADIPADVQAAGTPPMLALRDITNQAHNLTPASCYDESWPALTKAVGPNKNKATVPGRSKKDKKSRKLSKYEKVALLQTGELPNQPVHASAPIAELLVPAPQPQERQTGMALAVLPHMDVSSNTMPHLSSLTSPSVAEPGSPAQQQQQQAAMVNVSIDEAWETVQLSTQSQCGNPACSHVGQPSEAEWYEPASVEADGQIAIIEQPSYGLQAYDWNAVGDAFSDMAVHAPLSQQAQDVIACGLLLMALRSEPEGGCPTITEVLSCLDATLLDDARLLVEHVMVVHQGTHPSDSLFLDLLSSSIAGLDGEGEAGGQLNMFDQQLRDGGGADQLQVAMQGCRATDFEMDMMLAYSKDQLLPHTDTTPVYAAVSTDYPTTPGSPCVMPVIHEVIQQEPVTDTFEAMCVVSADAAVGGIVYQPLHTASSAHEATLHEVGFDCSAPEPNFSQAEDTSTNSPNVPSSHVQQQTPSPELHERMQAAMLRNVDELLESDVLALEQRARTGELIMWGSPPTSADGMCTPYHPKFCIEKGKAVREKLLKGRSPWSDDGTQQNNLNTAVPDADVSTKVQCASTSTENVGQVLEALCDITAGIETGGHVNRAHEQQAGSQLGTPNADDLGYAVGVTAAHVTAAQQGAPISACPGSFDTPTVVESSLPHSCNMETHAVQEEAQQLCNIVGPAQEQTQTLPAVSTAASAFADNLAQHTDTDRTHDAGRMHDQDAQDGAAAAGDVSDDGNTCTPASCQGTQDEAMSQQVYDAVYAAVYEKSTQYLLGTLSSPPHDGCETAGNCPTQKRQDTASQLPRDCSNSQAHDQQTLEQHTVLSGNKRDDAHNADQDTQQRDDRVVPKERELLPVQQPPHMHNAPDVPRNGRVSIAHQPSATEYNYHLHHHQQPDVPAVNGMNRHWYRQPLPPMQPPPLQPVTNNHAGQLMLLPLPHVLEGCGYPPVATQPVHPLAHVPMLPIFPLFNAPAPFMMPPELQHYAGRPPVYPPGHIAGAYAPRHCCNGTPPMLTGHMCPSGRQGPSPYVAVYHHGGGNIHQPVHGHDVPTYENGHGMHSSHGQPAHRHNNRYPHPHH